jgi:hypothetical protein
VPDLASTLNPNPPPDDPHRLNFFQRQLITYQENLVRQGLYDFRVAAAILDGAAQLRATDDVADGAAGGSATAGVRQERLDRVLARLNSLHEAAAQDAAAAAEAIAGRTTAGPPDPRQALLHASPSPLDSETVGEAARRSSVPHDDGDGEASLATTRRNSRQLGLLPNEDWQQRLNWRSLELPPPTNDRQEAVYNGRIGMSRASTENRIAQTQRAMRRQSERGTDPDRLERLGRDSHMLRRTFAGTEEALRQLDEQLRPRGGLGGLASARGSAEAAAAARAEARSEARARAAGAASLADPTRRHARLFASRSREYFERATRDYLASAESSDGNGSGSSGNQQQQQPQAGFATADGPSRPLPMIRTQSESSAATSVIRIEHAMSYLALLRGAGTRDDGVSVAMSAGFTYENLTNEDFMLDVHALEGPAPSSLLAPGARFAGNQYATAGPPEAGEREPRASGGTGTPPPRRSASTRTGGARSAGTTPARARTPATRAQQQQQQQRRQTEWLGRRDFAAGAAAIIDNHLLAVPRETRFAPEDREDGIGLDTPPSPPPPPPPPQPLPPAVTAALQALAASPGGGGGADDWPVKVSVFAVDYERMTLAACMEAFDVPGSLLSLQSLLDGQMPGGGAAATSVFGPAARALRGRWQQRGSGGAAGSGRRKAITTYLEGEIIDFKTHTLVTESFPSTPARDAAGWRRLLPFRDVPAPDLAARLVDRRWMETLSAEYVLMRWKERCFVAAAAGEGEEAMSLAASAGGPVGGGDIEAEGCGLTISGFYYISMRRSDGYVEGLYCDPQSSPYQFLRLEREDRCGMPGWGFR